MGDVVSSAVAVGAGALLGGFGAYRAGDQAAHTLNSIGDDVHHIRRFFEDRVERLMPGIELVLNDTHTVLNQANELLVTTNFAMKALTLLISLFIALLSMKLISESGSKNFQTGNRNSLPFFSGIEGLGLQIIYILSLLMAIVMSYLVVSEFFGVNWPNTVPVFIIVPSCATVFAILKSFKSIALGLVNIVWYVVYALAFLPLELSYDPIPSGLKYSKASNVFIPIVMTSFFLLYIIVAFLPVFLFKKYVIAYKDFKSPLLVIFIGYLLFYATAVITFLLGKMIRRHIFFPLWKMITSHNMGKRKKNH